MEKHNCLKCNHSWLPRKIGDDRRPRQCPGCKSVSWDNEGYLSCQVCARRFLMLHLHHKDGHPKNNIRDNIIKICGSCHMSIHQGLKEYRWGSGQGSGNYRKRTRMYNGPDIKLAEIRFKLKQLRTYWLNNRPEVKV